ncbi:polyhydroxyalkanoate depolymerase [Marinibactrum halimedae]|uniref:Esterase n=1 Tax=Marinibactrum halimedae TaxID=1444977 RepID=A0AA37WLN7_9GAMM|nr:polyhydroxyalkanoate depolymerase [Marinibactrum halimedae]MCD9459910.1 polyhydroxyalkanoate depolymerase [Marinibactrum halimedae]GLS25235.1 esterase [Marinibactrum halimedae]
MLYHLYEFNHAVLKPFRDMAGLNKKLLDSKMNPVGYTFPGRLVGAACDLFESMTRRYDKPEFGLEETVINGQPVAIEEEIIWSKPFANLIHFKRNEEDFQKAHGKEHIDPRVLLVAPLSGHYATLLRGTVEAFLPEHEVYITDWADARMVPVSQGQFDLNDYIDYVIEILQFLGPSTNVIGICQPGPLVLAAISLMSQANDDALPATMTFMGSPIDCRRSPTVPNKLAEERPLSWFRNNLIYTVPMPNPGAFRRVYPGFVQLSGFISMNQDMHINAHKNYFNHLIEGDCDSVAKHREFYNEYLAVLDLTQEFYLQTIEDVFQEHKLPRGILKHRGQTVDPSAITKVALMTVEGERDDISGIGQTQAAHDLCVNIPQNMQFDYIQPGVGHYGVFNGKRFRTEIQPRLKDFIRSFCDYKLEKQHQEALADKIGT